MSIASNLASDTSRLFDYTDLADEQTQIRADVKISDAVLNWLEAGNKAALSQAILDILNAYQAQLMAMKRAKNAQNAETITFALLVNNTPLALTGKLELGVSNHYWPTLVVRLAQSCLRH